MSEIYVKNFCSREVSPDGNPYFSYIKKGAAVTMAAAYPTNASRSELACGKALEISTESFIRRPSLADTAINTILSFVNDGVYIYQERDKKFLCNSAICYVLKGKARFIVSGNAVAYHFRNGELIYSVKGQDIPMFGERLHWKGKAEPEFDISHGTNALVVCSADDDCRLPDVLSDTLFLPDMDFGQWADAAVSSFHNMKCSAAVMVLPQRMPLMGKKFLGGQGKDNE